MEKKSRRFLLQNKRPVRRKDASLDLPPRSISACPPRRETEDHLPEQPPSWEVQWQEFLERVRSQEILEEADIWQEAKDLLATFDQNTQSRTQFGVLPQELRRWLAQHSLQTCSRALDLAEAFSSRKQQQSRCREKQAASGSCFSTAQKNSSDVQQKEDGKRSLLQLSADWCDFLKSPMEKRNPEVHLQRKRPVGTADASHDLQPGDVNKSPPRRKVERKDHVAPPGPSEAAAGSSSSTVQKSPSDVQEEEGGKLRHLGHTLESEIDREWSEKDTILDLSVRPRWQEGKSSEEHLGHTSEGENKQELPEEETALGLFVIPRRQERKSPEEQMEPSIPSRGGADQEQEERIEEREDTNSGRRSRINTDEEKYECLVCRQSFNKLRLLRLHLRTHTGEKPFKCLHCDLSFDFHLELKVHMRIHTGEKLHVCLACGKRFSRKSHLLSHRRVHTGEKPFSCLLCRKSFSWKTNLLRHLKIHAREKTYLCSDCGRSFSQNEHLVKHQRIHTGEKSYVYLDCRSTFNQKEQLNQHKNIHTGEKPHKCPVCGKGFSRKTHLNQHKIIHTGEKPHKCPVCGKAFTRKEHLIRHQKIHKGKKPN